MTDEEHSAEDPVEALLFECLEILESEGMQALERLLAQHPELADAVRRRLDALQRAGLAPSGTGDFPDQLGDFRLLEQLGHGGMGVVYRAQQESIGRDVALKLVRPELLYFPKSRERFRREVETIGALHHPGIVPIHTVGEQNGIPFYAMELVPGVDLAHVIRFAKQLVQEDSGTSTAPKLRLVDLTGSDFYNAIKTGSSSGNATGDASDSKLPPFFNGTWIQVCVRVIREVTEALDHAHRRGVIHRDIKPSNIMITPDGRVLLLDFGLASTMSSGRVTRTGSQLGTLPYMSPEQLSASKDLDERTDIYSLGAVLFELLCLEVPVRGKDASELIDAIRNGASTALRKHNPQTSWEHQAICSAAMDLERSERYPTASAFAADLDAVLNGRPIAARRTPPLRKLLLWAKRRPATAAAIALAILSVVALAVVSSIYAFKLSNKNKDLQAATEASERRFEEVRELARAFVFELDNQLKAIAGSTDARQFVVDRGLSYLNRLLPEAKNHPRLRQEIAQGYMRIAQIQGGLYLSNLGQTEEARINLNKAHLLLRELALQLPEDLDIRHDLSGVLHDLAANAQRRGLIEEAVQGFERVVEMRRKNYSLSEQPEHLRALLVALNSLAPLEQRISRMESAGQHYEEALEMAKQLDQEHSTRGTREDLIYGLGRLGYYFKFAGRPKEARKYLEQALDQGHRLIEDYPDDGRYTDLLSSALLDLGDLHWSAGELVEALAVFGCSADLRKKLYLSDPNNVSAMNDYSTALERVAEILDTPADRAPALRTFEESLRLRRKRVTKDPDDMAGLQEYAVGLEKVGNILGETGHFAEALAGSTMGLEIYERLICLAPDDMRAYRGYSVTKYKLGTSWHIEGERLKATTREGRKAFQNARNYYQGALDNVEAMIANDRLPVGDEGVHDLLTERIAACDEALGQAR